MWYEMIHFLLVICKFVSTWSTERGSTVNVNILNKEIKKIINSDDILYKLLKLVNKYTNRMWDEWQPWVWLEIYVWHDIKTISIMD